MLRIRMYARRKVGIIGFNEKKTGKDEDEHGIFSSCAISL